MRLIDYEEELFAVKIQNGSELVDSYWGDGLQYDFTIDGWRFKFVDFEDDIVKGCAYRYEKLVEVSNNCDIDITLLHEMIHVYESILESHKLDDYVLIRLYDELSQKINNLKQLINMDKHSLNKEHSLLFMLKSLKLDLEFGYKLGTIYDYDRANLYKD